MGSGKSTLAKQLVCNMLQKEYHVLYYAIEEGEEDIKGSISALGLDRAKLDNYVSEGMLHIADMFNLGVKRLAEAPPSEEPTKIIDNTFNFSELLSLGRRFTLKNIGKKQFAVLDSVTPLFLTVDSKKVFQFAQILRFATRLSKGIGIAILHTGILGEPVENACFNFADIVIEMQKRKVAEAVTRGGSIKLLKAVGSAVTGRDFYYELTERGIVVSTMPPL
jgi:KaiC/GvpD/RAD55 family RecA-like ATPase